eukprot:PhM_4_TR3815/c0_g1_i2/m.91994
MLQFEVRAAKNLSSATISTICPDTLCVVEFANANERRQSNVHYGCHSPAFNESYRVPMVSAVEEVTVSVYDGEATERKLVGVGSLHVGGLMRDVGTTWLQVYRSGAPTGSVHVLWQVHTLSTTPAVKEVQRERITETLEGVLRRLEGMETTMLRLEQRQRAIEARVMEQRTSTSTSSSVGNNYPKPIPYVKTTTAATRLSQDEDTALRSIRASPTKVAPSEHRVADAYCGPTLPSTSSVPAAAAPPFVSLHYMDQLVTDYAHELRDTKQMLSKAMLGQLPL